MTPHLTQPELGAAAGIARETISNIERGFSEPGVPVALAGASAAGGGSMEYIPVGSVPPQE